MMNKRLKQGSTFLLALALTFPLLALPGARAANAVETDKTDCSLEFSVGGNNDELKTTEIKVDLYKVASIDESGNYTAIGAFKKLDLSSVSADDLDASAATWAERAKEAQKMLKEDTAPAKSITLENGAGTADNLETGLYLVDTKKVITANYTYTFTPYLVSLPTNNYYTTNHDDWIYNLTGDNAVGLKPEQHARYGDLIINKELVSHNATLGDKATFVFQIDITTPDHKTETRIEEITFDAAGNDSVTIKKIPAGSTVVVKEIYSGASYKLTSPDNQTATIVANAEEEAGAAGATAEVSFTNEHDGRINGGYGVRNNFKLDENDQYQYTGNGSKK